jgi:puromycin-sensitive aminopeptidase
LNRHKYANAVTEDLWAALAEASGKPVKELMDHWTKQDGYPVVTITEKEGRGGGRTFELSQSRFLSTGPDPSDRTLWWIPLGLASPRGVVKDIVKERDVTLTLSDVSADDWVLANPGMTGFYRVKYPDTMLAKIRPAITNFTLSAVDRLGIQGDAFALARAGMGSTTNVLELLEAYRAENDYTVLMDMSTNLGDLSLIVQHLGAYDIFKRYARSLFEKVGEDVGWDVKQGESHLTALLRSLVIGRLGLYGHPATIEEARRRFARFQEDQSTLVADLRSEVYKICLANAPEGDSSIYDAVLRIFRGTDLQEEKVRCMRALGFASDPALLKKTLEFAVSDEVRSQDTVFVIASVSANPKGRDMAWEFVKENWDSLYERYSGGFLLSRLVQTTAGAFATLEKAAEVEAYFATKKAAAAERAIKQAVEGIRSNAAWLQRDGHAIRAWLENWASKHQ